MLVFFSSLLSAKGRLTLTLSKSLFLLYKWWWSSFNLPFFPFCNLTTILYGDGPQSIIEGWQKVLTAVNLPKMLLIYTFLQFFAVFIAFFAFFAYLLHIYRIYGYLSHLRIFIAFTDFYRIYRYLSHFSQRFKIYGFLQFLPLFYSNFFAVNRKFFLRFTVIYGLP